MEPLGFFYNPNIHPFREFERRVEALEQVSKAIDLPIVWDESGYGLESYLKKLNGRTSPEERCPVCYRMRLEKAALQAVKLGLKLFTTTLLYSRYQRHELIAEMGKDIAQKYNIDFYYQDFRLGWTKGIEMSKELGIYRQPYCGCIFSELERYNKRAERLRKRWSDESTT